MTQLTEAARAPTEADTGSTLAALAAVVGAGNVFSGEDIEAKHRGDLTGKFKALPAFVVRPASTEQVCAVSRSPRPPACRSLPLAAAPAWWAAGSPRQAASCSAWSG